VHLFERALALRERRVWTAGEEASGAAAAHLHALLLLLTGLSSAAAAALHRHCARHPPSAQAHALLAIVLSHRGQPQEAVQALHRALVLERGCGGTGAVRLLYNLVAVHDEHSQNDVALNMSDFLWEAAAEVHHAQDAGAAYQSAAGMGAAEASMALPYGGMTDAHPGLQGRSLTPTLVALHLDAIPSPAAPQQSAPPRKGLRESEAEAGRVRAAGEVETNPGFPPSNMREASNDCHARFRLFAAGGLSLPLARYVHARAQLLCGQWRPAADALRDLALSGPQCLASLSALGVDSTQLLSQASLAQLYDGAYDEVVQMLEQVGAADRPQLRMMYADALLGLERADDALGHLAIPTDQADEMHNDGDALLGGGVPAQAPHGSSVGAPALGPGGVYREEAPGAGGLASVDSDDAREEARWRNNRACLLMCAGQPDRAEAELRRCCQLCPEDLEHEFNLCLVLWKMGERREACDRWLRRRGYPIDATAATYCRLADAVRPTAAEAEGSRAEGHATGRLDDAQRAGLDRLALRYFEELKSVEEFPSCWWGGAGGSLTA
jgi:tetratricopeptide (TPR) repeat protein